MWKLYRFYYFVEWSKTYCWTVMISCVFNLNWVVGFGLHISILQSVWRFLFHCEQKSFLCHNWRIFKLGICLSILNESFLKFKLLINFFFNRGISVGGNKFLLSSSFLRWLMIKLSYLSEQIYNSDCMDTNICRRYFGSVSNSGLINRIIRLFETSQHYERSHLC